MIAAALLTFVAVVIGVISIFYAVEARNATAIVKRRLRDMANGVSEVESSAARLLKEVSPEGHIVARLPFLGRLQKLLVHAGVRFGVLQFTALCAAGAACAGLIAAILWKRPVISVFAAVLVCLVAFVFLHYRTKQRQALFTEQLPDALCIMSRSLRAGHALAGAVELVSQDLPEPSASLFKHAYEQQNLGVRMAEAMESLLEKIDSMDLHFLVTIVKINSDTGGNLAEVLDKLAETVRIRLQIRKQVEVVTAEGRLSGYVLLALPQVILLLFYLMRPQYVSVFFTERLCQMWLLGAIAGQGVGYLMIRKIVNIRI